MRKFEAEYLGSGQPKREIGKLSEDNLLGATSNFKYEDS